MAEDIGQANLNGDGIQINGETPNGQAPEASESEKLLQAEMTRNRQALIATATKLASSNVSELHSIEDSKLKDSVSRNLYWMAYNEAVAVFGANFASKKSDDDKGWDDVIESQNKKIRLLEYKQEEANIDAAIAAHKASSPWMWTEGSGMTPDKIREELANISTTLPVDDRVRRAANIAMGSVFDNTSMAYQLLNKGKINAGGMSWTTKDVKTEADDKSNALSSYLKGRMGMK